MNRLLLLAGLLLGLLPTSAQAQDLVITGIVDGPLGGGTPKAIEIFVLNDVADLSAYGVANANNGGATFSTPFVLSGSATAGDFLYVASEAPNFTAFFGFAPDFTTGVLGVNGDDVVGLFQGATLIDVFGELGVDGTGQPWEYLDGWAYRVNSTGPETTFNAANWTFSGINALDGETTNASAATPMPVGTYTAGGPPPAESASVTFSPTTGTVEEGNIASVTVLYTLSNSDGNDTNNPVVSGGIAVTSGNGDQVTFGGTFTFGATTPSGTTSTYSVTAVDDGDYTGTRNVVFGFNGVTGGTSSGTFTLTITDDELPPPVTTTVVISEVDPNQTGTDAGEFVELYDGGAGNTPLDGLVLVLINGNGNVSYGSFDLDGFATDAEGYFVLCGDIANVPTCDLDVSPNTNLIQNGPDAVALYEGDATAWPNGTAATTAQLVDAVVYGTSREAALLTALGQTVQYSEGYGGDSDGESLQRLSLSFGVATRSGGLPTTTGLLYTAAPTPGAANATSFTVDATPSVTPGAGWRMLSAPLYNTDLSAIRVDDLAGLNLVQGIPAGAPSTLYPAQYPAAGANLFTSYTGTNVYASPTGTDAELNPGQGFYWYWYDQDITPDPGSFGGGTSVSYALDNPAFAFSWTGLPLDDEWNGAVPSILHPVTADGFYMSGNPFAYPVRLGGVSASSGTLSSVFNVWDPAGAAGAGSYTLLTADFATPSAGDALPPWNGVFAEITGASAPLDISVTSAAVDPTTSRSLVGRSASPEVAERRLAFALTGTLDSGTAVGDEAAMVRFVDGGTLGWDAHDGSKLRPLQNPFALVAPVGERGGAPHVQSARSLPAAIADDVTMPLAVWASGSGSFSLRWDRSAFPAEWSALLLDTVTGTTVNLQAQDSYAFTSGATGAWTNRFELTVSPRIVATEGGADADAFVGTVFPNPTAGAAALTLQPAASGRVTAAVYDALGRQVAVAFDGDVQAGAETRVDLPTALAPGVYVVRVSGETFAQTRRFVVTR